MRGLRAKLRVTVKNVLWCNSRIGLQLDCKSYHSELRENNLYAKSTVHDNDFFDSVHQSLNTSGNSPSHKVITGGGHAPQLAREGKNNHSINIMVMAEDNFKRSLIRCSTEIILQCK